MARPQLTLGVAFRPFLLSRTTYGLYEMATRQTSSELPLVTFHGICFLLGGGREWCRLAYWEGRERVGHEQFSVCSPSVEVFATVSSGNKNVPQQRPGRRRTWLRRNSDSCGGNGSANGGGSGSDARGGLRNKIGRGEDALFSFLYYGFVEVPFFAPPCFRHSAEQG